MTQLRFGLHPVKAALDKELRIDVIYLLKGREDKPLSEIINLAKQQNITLQYTSRDELDQLCQHGNHQGVAARCELTQQLTEKDLYSHLDTLNHAPFILILDQVQDPHNLGACLRSADGAGVDAVIIPKDRSASITPTVSKVACGAAETIPLVTVTNLARCLRELKQLGIWLYGLAGEAQQDIYQTDLRGPVALILGAEGKGMRELTKKHCDGLISIPMLGYVSSLNVSVATGVCLFEALRQRQN